MSEIRRIRKQKSITTNELAEKTEISPMSIYRYETGKRYPSILIAAKIAKVLGVTVDELFRKEKPK